MHTIKYILSRHSRIRVFIVIYSMLSTVHQRNIEKLFQEKEQISLTELKKICVDSSEMNQTTLYRILDRWKNEGKLHELLIDKERVFLYCSSPLEDA